MNFTAIDKILARAVSTGTLPGVTAGVTNGSETIFSGAAGTTLIGGGDEVTPDTVFWIASMTKPVTSIAAMQLVEQGKLSLDAPLGDMLPELQNPQIIEGGKFRPATQKITLRHLLTHTAGFSYPYASAEYIAAIAAHPNPPRPGTRAGINAPLLFEPGERWEYGFSTDWAGLAVEAASGETLDVYFENHIFAPLGMKNTSFNPATAQAAIHRRRSDDSLVVCPSPLPKDLEFCPGGSGLYSTLNDYLKFLRMFLAKGAGIVSPETIAAMSVNQIGQVRAGYMPSADGPGIDANPGMDSKFGLGFLIYPQTGPFGRSAGSLTWSGMANTYFWIDPAKTIAGVILMQILPSGDPGALKTFFGFEQAVYAAVR